jgi:hypothetical protein
MELCDRFILVIEGWGHPDPPRFVWKTDLPIHDRVNYRPYLARFRDALIAHSRETGRRMLVDMHEATSEAAALWLTEPERYSMRAIVKSLWENYRRSEISRNALVERVLQELFPDEQEARIMRRFIEEMIDRAATDDDTF